MPELDRERMMIPLSIFHGEAARPFLAKRADVTDESRREKQEIRDPPTLVTSLDRNY